MVLPVPHKWVLMEYILLRIMDWPCGISFLGDLGFKSPLALYFSVYVYLYLHMQGGMAREGGY